MKKEVEKINKELPFVKAEFKKSIYAAGIAIRQGYDVFLYENSTYFDKWDEQRNEGSYQMLTVYKNTQLKTETICRFQYHLT